MPWYGPQSGDCSCCTAESCRQYEQQAWDDLSDFTQEAGSWSTYTGFPVTKGIQTSDSNAILLLNESAKSDYGGMFPYEDEKTSFRGYAEFYLKSPPAVDEEVGGKAGVILDYDSTNVKVLAQRRYQLGSGWRLDAWLIEDGVVKDSGTNNGEPFDTGTATIYVAYDSFYDKVSAVVADFADYPIPLSYSRTSNFTGPFGLITDTLVEAIEYIHIIWQNCDRQDYDP